MRDKRHRLFRFLGRLHGERSKEDEECLCKSNERYFFSPTPPSESSSVQEFMCSCNEPPPSLSGLSDDEKLGIVYPFVVTERGTGNRRSFDLARAITTSYRNMNMNDKDEIFRLWFAKSRPFLPSDVDEAKALATFYRQLTRVRFTDTALQAACERALKSEWPFLAARDGDEKLAKLAALHRELQRDTGAKSYICPVTVIVDFIPVHFRPQANYLNYELEHENVIECVERGSPYMPGRKGKPTYWRYLLPLDQ